MLAARYSARLLGLAAVGLALPGRADPPDVNKAVDPADGIRKSAAAAEVHAVGIYQPASGRVGADDITDWPKFVDALRSRKGPGGRVVDLFLADDKRALGLLADDAVAAAVGTERLPHDLAAKVAFLKAAVAQRLTRGIDRPDFYDEEAFKGVILGREVKDSLALGGKRTPHQTAVMNRRLLAAAFPRALAETPDRFRVARVEVAPGKPVVLVLSSHEPCRWEVRVRDGAKVAGVVLGGWHPQEVAGVADAPVLHRTRYGPDGKPWADGKKSFQGYDAKADTHKVFVAAIQDLTGKELTSFVGENTPGPESEPYTIRPVGHR